MIAFYYFFLLFVCIVITFRSSIRVPINTCVFVRRFGIFYIRLNEGINFVIPFVDKIVKLHGETFTIKSNEVFLCGDCKFTINGLSYNISYKFTLIISKSCKPRVIIEELCNKKGKDLVLLLENMLGGIIKEKYKKRSNINTFFRKLEEQDLVRNLPSIDKPLQLDQIKISIASVVMCINMSNSEELHLASTLFKSEDGALPPVKSRDTLLYK